MCDQKLSDPPLLYSTVWVCDQKLSDPPLLYSTVWVCDQKLSDPPLLYSTVWVCDQKLSDPPLLYSTVWVCDQKLSDLPCYILQCGCVIRSKRVTFCGNYYILNVDTKEQTMGGGRGGLGTSLNLLHTCLSSYTLYMVPTLWW